MTTRPDLRQATVDLLKLVQSVSGYPTVVDENRDLQMTAALRMACGPRPVHVIEYNPDLVSEPDYYVAVQCGHILRFFAPPASERKDLAATTHGLESVRKPLSGKA